MTNNEFNNLEINNLDIEVIDGDRGKNYPHKDELLSYGDCLFLSATNVTSNGFSFTDKVFITKQKDKILRNGKLKYNDIVITTRGTVGNIAIYTNDIPYSNMRINSGMLIVRCSSAIDSKFLYYVLKSNNFQKQIKAIQTGTAQPQLPKSHFLKMQVPVPSKTTQQKIAKVLSVIDDKIELNNRINNNLEQQAQIQFNNYINNHTCKKLPLNRISNIKYGKGLPTKNLTESGYKVFGGNGIIGRYTDYMYETPQILVSCRGAASGNILESHHYSYITNNSLIIELNDSKYYQFVKQFLLLNPLFAYATGSAQPQITIDNIKEVLIPYPEYSDIHNLDLFLCSLYKMKFKNIYENERLTQVRDTLLPKLMSGEIDVENVDISTDKLSFN